jgi:hypothetical protein
MEISDILSSLKEQDSDELLLYLIFTSFIIFLIAGDPVGIGSRYKTVPGARVVGARYPLEPRWWTRYRFYSSGYDIIQKGSEKVIRMSIFAEFSYALIMNL